MHDISRQRRLDTAKNDANLKIRQLNNVPTAQLLHATSNILAVFGQIYLLFIKNLNAGMTLAKWNRDSVTLYFN